MYFSFSHSSFLALLLIIPIFILIHFISLRSRRTKALKFANFEAISRIKGVDFFSRNLTLLSINCLIIILLVFSLAGATVHFSAKTSSFSYVVAIDSSRSMEANDLEPSRFIAAKEEIKNFISSSPVGTRIGIVSFSGNSLIEEEVTEDKLLLYSSLEEVTLSETGGTDIEEAVITSANILRGEETKAIVLISDGQLNVGSLEKAIGYALDNDVIVHTIAIGSEEGGETVFGISRVDSDSLEALAYNTNGNFFNVSKNSDLSLSFENIRNYTDKIVAVKLTPYLIFTSIFLVIIVFLLLNVRYGILP